MSGKRSLKKQQKRQASALAQLEELYRRGTDADDELLARAAELGANLADLAVSPFAARWAEVADRALLRSLAGADLGRLDRLLRTLRRNGPPRPLAILAKAVLDLAAGRREEARASLAALEDTIGGIDGIPGLPPRLLTDLRALARDEDRPRKAGAYPRAAAELFASLQALEAQSFAPTAADRKALARRLRTLRGLAQAEAPETQELRRLLDGADRYLGLLADLAALQATVEKDETRAPQAVDAWIRRTGSPLGVVLGAAVPPLLAPLHHAVVTGWRSVLERVAARQGAPGLAALWTADPRLLAHHLDLPGGAQGGHEGLRQRAQARQLLAERRFEELADLLRSRGRSTSAAADLAALWSLELWARGHWDDEPEDEDDEAPPPDLSEPYPHRTLVRLAEMAGEIGRRIPAEQRAGVARVLAEELFDVGDAVGFCDHTAGAALSLLEHLSEDTLRLGLLLSGIAGAISGGAPRSLRTLLAPLDRGGKGTAEASPIAKRVLAQISAEPPQDLALILEAVQPLFSAEAWPEIAETVARGVSGSFGALMAQVILATLQGPRSGGPVLEKIRQGLDSLRPALAATLSFAAMELTLDCWRSGGAAVEKRLVTFLDAFPGWEAAATALRVLEKARTPWSPQGLNLAALSLAQAAIDRLDERWQLWSPAVPLLALAADRAPLKRLENKIRQLLASPEVRGEDREVLLGGLTAIHQIGSMKHGPASPRRQKKGAKRKKKPARRLGRAPQLQLDFP